MTRQNDPTKTGRNARLRARKAKVEITADELEAERAAILVELDKPGPLTDELRQRIAAVAEADARAGEEDEYGMAVRDLLAEALAVMPPTGPAGITIHDRGSDILEFTLGEKTLLMLDRPTVAARVAERRRRRAVGRQ